MKRKVQSLDSLQLLYRYLPEGIETYHRITSRRDEILKSYINKSLCRNVNRSTATTGICVTPDLTTELLQIILSHDRLIIQEVWTRNWIYWTLKQLVTTFYNHCQTQASILSHGLHCAAWLTSSNNGRSSASGLMSSQAAGNLTPNSYSSDCCLQCSNFCLPSPRLDSRPWYRVPSEYFCYFQSFMCLEMGLRLRREEGSDYHWSLPF
jgi:hypothetical protein